MQYMGTTDAAGTAVVEASPQQYMNEAQAILQGKNRTEAIRTVKSYVSGVVISANFAKSRGEKNFDSRTVKMLQNSFAKALALVSVLVQTYSPTKSEMADIDSKLTQVEKTWETLSQWDASARDALLMLQDQKQRALARGDMSDPVLTESERAYYITEAKAGRLNYNQSGLVLSDDAKAKIANYKAQPRLGPAAIVTGGIAAAAALFLMTR